MDLNDTDMDWMKDAPALAAMVKKNPFTIPDGYFETLNEHLNARISIDNLASVDFDIPKDYFEQLPAQIEARISLDNIKSIAPEHGFTVPVGYFENLEENIISQTTIKGSTIKSKKVISLKWINYAAAACITLALGSVLVLNLRSNSIEAQMKTIPDQEIINYLQAHTDVGDTPAIIENLDPNNNLSETTKGVSTEELEQYINTTTL